MQVTREEIAVKLKKMLQIEKMENDNESEKKDQLHPRKADCKLYKPIMAK